MKHILFKAGIFALLAMTQITKSDVKVINTTPYPIRVVMFIEAAQTPYVRSDEIPTNTCQWLSGDGWANKYRYIVQLKEKRSWITIWDTKSLYGGRNADSSRNRELLVIGYGSENPTYTVTDNEIGLGGGTRYLTVNNQQVEVQCMPNAGVVRWGAEGYWTPEQAWDNAYGRTTYLP